MSRPQMWLLVLLVGDTKTMDDIFDKIEEDIENIGKKKKFSDIDILLGAEFLLGADEVFDKYSHLHEMEIRIKNHNQEMEIRRCIQEMERERYVERERTICRCGEIYVIEYRKRRISVGNLTDPDAMMTINREDYNGFHCIKCGEMFRVLGKITKIYGEDPQYQWMNWRI